MKRNPNINFNKGFINYIFVDINLYTYFEAILFCSNTFCLYAAVRLMYLKYGDNNIFTNVFMDSNST